MSRINVIVGDDKLCVWDDDANIYYPEDLTWGRSISDVFWTGVKIGRNTDSDEQISIEREKDDKEM